MSYLKVYRPSGSCSVEEVKNALPQDISGLKVDDDLGDVSVVFPNSVSRQEMEKVEKHLESQGFKIS